MPAGDRSGTTVIGEQIASDFHHFIAPLDRGLRQLNPMSMHSLQDKGKEIAFFDAHAASDEYDVFTPQANARLIAAFMRLSGLPRGGACGRSGLGSGSIHRTAATAGLFSIGVDISPKLVALGRSKYPGLELIEGDAENLPFESESLDGVLLSGTGTSFSRSEAAGRLRSTECLSRMADVSSPSIPTA